jgi:Na+/H+-dicarboxylate symporter
MKKIKLHWQIAISLASALAASLLVKSLAAGQDLPAIEYAQPLVAVCSFLGNIFFNALKMIVVPLIVTSIISGMMGLGEDKNFGRLGLKTLSYYMTSGLVAILTGLLLVNLIQPGNVDEDTANAILSQANDPAAFMSKVEGRGSSDFVGIFVRMVPPNVVHAATDNGQLLGVIFFSLLFGFFISHLPGDLKEFQTKLWESLLAVMTHITDLIIKFTPLGVFGLLCPVLIETGIDAFRPLILFFITVLLSLGIHMFVTLPLALRFFASSASTLPVTMECMQKDAGVSKRVSSFTLPLGATVNMDGTALYECVVVIFIAQFYAAASGVAMGLTTQFNVVVLALLTSVGVAGIPSASLVAIAVILAAVGLPIEAIGIVMVVDRILDMCRTSVNVFSDTCGAAIVDATEKKINLQVSKRNPTV